MDSGAKKLATEVPVSAADNGKVLSVVNGAWAAATIPSGAYAGSYTGDGTKSRNITLEFAPKVVFILIEIDARVGGTPIKKSNLCTLINGMTYTLETSIPGKEIKLSLSHNALSYTTNDSNTAYGNETGKVYNYVLLA